MAGQTFVNPFTPQTPIGAGLQNIAIALFNGKQGDVTKAALQAQQGDMAVAHGDLYREQARKADAERRLAESLLGARSYDTITDVAAANAGMPGYTFRAIHDASRGAGDISQYSPEEQARYRRAWAATMPGYADKTVDPSQIAKALQLQEEIGHRDAIIGGRAPLPYAQAYFATSGKAPFDNMGGTGTFNLMTGDQSLNRLGNARVGAEDALRDERAQRARGLRLEADTGVKIGPPVVVGGEGGDVAFTAPTLAAKLGLTPGRDPNRAGGGRGAGGAATDTTTTTPLKPIDLKRHDGDLLLGAIDRAAGGKLADKMLEGTIMSRAQAYFRTPGSPAYGLHEEAARRAVMDIVPSGFESPFFGNQRAKGEIVVNPGEIALTGPTTQQRTVTRGKTTVPPATGAPAAQGKGGKSTPGVPTRPAGKTDAQLIDEANAAIKAGKDRNAVMQRLQAWGVQTL